MGSGLAIEHLVARGGVRRHDLASPFTRPLIAPHTAIDQLSFSGRSGQMLAAEASFSLNVFCVLNFKPSLDCPNNVFGFCLVEAGSEPVGPSAIVECDAATT